MTTAIDPGPSEAMPKQHRESADKPAKFDIYQRVTDAIIRQLEAGAGEWRMLWHSKHLMPRSIRGPAYRGINVPILWIAAQDKGYTSPVWGTYKAWAEKGAQVRKGEKATTIVFWKDYSGIKAESEDELERRFVARGYYVFNAEQVDGYPITATELHPRLPGIARIAEAETFFAGLGSVVQHGGHIACYVPSRDLIRMPPFADFHEPEGYYSVLGHEHIHWTGAKHRLDRDFGKRYGDQASAYEELTAELGAAFLCAVLGISNEPRPDHAQYLQHWLTILKENKRAIFTAASGAQRAVDYLMELGGRETAESEEPALSAAK
jgi:antirestriction protein ArdC